MTKHQLQAELAQVTEKIRGVNESLKTLRAHHTGLKARLSDARAAEKANRKPE